MSKYAQYEKMVDRNIGPLIDIEYLVRTYQAFELTEAFFTIVNQYKCYRPILGDGNCFYRAVAFSYLRQADLREFDRAFIIVDNYCINFPQNIRSGNLIDQLFDIYQYYLAGIQNLYGVERQEALVSIFNKVNNFDPLMIMYLRSINYREICSNWQMYKPYINMEENNTLDPRSNVKLYYNEAEGLEIDAMANALNIKIVNHTVLESGYKEYVYNQQCQKQIDLFFRPGHYDIVYNKNSIYLKGYRSNLQQQITTPMYQSSQRQKQSAFSPFKRNSQLNQASHRKVSPVYQRQRQIQPSYHQQFQRRTNNYRQRQENYVPERFIQPNIFPTKTNHPKIDQIKNKPNQNHQNFYGSNQFQNTHQDYKQKQKSYDDKRYQSPKKSKFQQAVRNEYTPFKPLVRGMNIQTDQKNPVVQGAMLFLIASIIYYIYVSF